MISERDSILQQLDRVQGDINGSALTGIFYEMVIKQLPLLPQEGTLGELIKHLIDPEDKLGDLLTEWAVEEFFKARQSSLHEKQRTLQMQFVVPQYVPWHG